MSEIEFTCRPRPPFRLDLTVWALRRRAHNEIDRWDGQCYARTLSCEGRVFELKVAQIGSLTRPRLGVAVVGPRIGEEERRRARLILDRLLGLRSDLKAFYAHAREDAHLAPLVARFEGVHPPRFPSVFETLINAIACQQLSLDAGIHLINRLARAFGRSRPGDSPAAAPAFPEPRMLRRATVERLCALKFSRQKARAVREVAAAANGYADVEALGRRSDTHALARLQAIHGIGRWSAEYVLLRGLGRTHVFPGDDVGARHGLERWLGLEQPLDYEETARVLERWRPYAGLVYFHLLLARLEQEGKLLGTQP